MRAWLGLLVCVSVAPAGARADETSADDKLRILYASRLTFTDDGLPLVTIEIVGGRDEITLSADRGLIVRPDGDGGSAVAVAGGDTWTIRATGTRPAELRDWVVVARLGVDDVAGVDAATTRWTDRGHDPRTFEIGTVFAVDGEVIDTRETLVAIRGKRDTIAKRYGISTTIHRELVRRPSGTIVADSAGTRIDNPSVLWFTARDPGDTIRVDGVPVGAGGSQLDVKTETRSYWGAVYVTLDSAGKLVAVNAVAEDRLLAGLVPAEIYPDAPDAALEAQAIAARTELLHKIGRRNTTDPFLLCSTQQCQVYAGAGREHERTTRAVARTRGIVVVRDGGGLADIRYSAACGGHGEHNDHVWGGDPDPSLRGKTDAGGKDGARFSTVDDDNIEEFLADDPARSWCGKASLGKGRHRWTVELSAAELDALVAKHYPKVGSVRSLTPKERGVSGRVRAIEIAGTKGTVVAEGDLHIRRLLGGLKSTLFVVDVVRGKKRAPETFRFRGAGFGHGVGMCQIGAIGMAEAGKTRAQILDHYYRGTHLHRLY
jgi:stage II sporulation protein D